MMTMEDTASTPQGLDQTATEGTDADDMRHGPDGVSALSEQNSPN
jgi:hypothetical protein